MICPNCNNKIADDSNFCKYCGAAFVEESETVIDIIPDDPYSENTDAERKTRSKKTVALLIVAAVLLLILIGVLVMFLLIGANKTTEISVTDVDGSIKQITSVRSLTKPEEILAEYTDVMNKLKADAPAFSRTNYQNLPTDKQNLGAIGNVVLPIVEKYVTSKSAVDPVTFEKGNANKLPVYESQYGCLLTDASKIKNAYCEVLDDNDYKLVITLTDEINPSALQPGSDTADGTINSMFAPYEATKEITAITELTVVSTMDFNYTNCTAELVYDHESKEVKSLKMTMNIDITLDTIFGTLTAGITDITEFSDFNY